ncbi:MAG TPA: hypothetical protein VL856_04475 [Acidimicrobiia bacterium]|jgi:hypothetical protein|nr:hypothetical protein [Acidimicrobiia bacterium]
MRATDLKPSRKVRNGQGIPNVNVDVEIPSYLQRYENERVQWAAAHRTR